MRPMEATLRPSRVPMALAGEVCGTLAGEAERCGAAACGGAAHVQLCLPLVPHCFCRYSQARARGNAIAVKGGWAGADALARTGGIGKAEGAAK